MRIRASLEECPAFGISDLRPATWQVAVPSRRSPDRVFNLHDRHSDSPVQFPDVRIEQLSGKKRKYDMLDVLRLNQRVVRPGNHNPILKL